MEKDFMIPIKTPLIRLVASGIKFKDTKRAIITIGSTIQAICIPNKAKNIMRASIKYFIFLSAAFALSDKLSLGNFIELTQSLKVPKGHIHPQKNLPKANEANIITMETIDPDTKTLSLMDTAKIAKGSI